MVPCFEPGKGPKLPDLREEAWTQSSPGKCRRWHRRDSGLSGEPILHYHVWLWFPGSVVTYMKFSTRSPLRLSAGAVTGQVWVVKSPADPILSSLSSKSASRKCSSKSKAIMALAVFLLCSVGVSVLSIQLPIPPSFHLGPVES